MSRSPKNQLSKPQANILRAVEGYHQQFGYAPTIREIGDRTGISSTSHVCYHLKKLQELGLVDYTPGASRTIRIINTGLVNASLQAAVLRIPVAGRIRAGAPVPMPSSSLAFFDEESYFDLPFSLLPKKTEGLFALEVEGDSMIDAMVQEGDVVILQSVKQVNNGEMVAAWLKGEEETTLKRYYQENNQVRLQPANPAYQPIILPCDEVEIQGKVVLIIRKEGAML